MSTDTPTDITQSDINNAVWAACDTFRGTVDAADYKFYVLAMLFLKYLSDVHRDRLATLKEQHGDEPELIAALMEAENFVMADGADFYTLHAKRFEPGNGERINKALHAIEDANIGKLRNVFQDIDFNGNKLGDEKQKNELLRELLNDFNRPALDLRPSRLNASGKPAPDIIGNAYEHLIKKFASGAGKSAGEFYTPPEVSDLMAQLVAPEPGDHICDPACGSASLLMKCGRYIAREHGTKEYALFGQESIGHTWALAKMNLFLHNETNHRVEWGDTLRNPKLLGGKGGLRHFDVVVANPPFSLKKWGHATAEDDPFGRFERGIPPKTKGDYAFILHMVETLKPKTGRMAVVVPHGVLFRGSAEGRIRQKLVEENLIDAVIGLPEKLFYGTGIPAAILVIRKRKTDDKTLFIDASRDFVPGKNQNAFGPEQLERIVSTYAERPDHVDKYAQLVSQAEMAENDYNLNIPRYVDTFEPEPEVDLMAVRVEREALKAEMAELEARMEGFLEELGYVGS